tara:strand:- start:506 stop:1312 length:807 start_codon:yes stop_codon:yes gene_type:complete
MDKQFLIAFSVTLLAGLSTVVGSLVVFFNNSKKLGWLSFSMAFASGVMLYVTFVEIIPSSLEIFLHDNGDTNFFINNHYLNLTLFFLVGCGVAVLIEKLLPDQKINNQIGKNFSTKKKIYRSGLLIAISLALHNFPEGIITFMECYTNLISGLAIALAIALHNIPEGMSISVPIYHSTGSKKKAIWYTALSGVTEPIGALFCFYLIKDGLNPFIEAAIMSFVGGIMVFIATFVLLPMSLEYKSKFQHVFGLISGIVIIGLSILMMDSI